MNWADSIMGFVRANETLILLILAALVFCLLITILYLLIKLGRLSKNSIRTAATVVESPSLDIVKFGRRIGRSEEGIALLDERNRVLDERMTRSIQRIGLVRFNAFADIGGEQSFALALLDRELNGVVLSSLFGRTDSRVYAKEIAGGCSQHTLSDEEKEAVHRAGNIQI
jgi:hypothetical protein